MLLALVRTHCGLEPSVRIVAASYHFGWQRRSAWELFNRRGIRWARRGFAVASGPQLANWQERRNFRRVWLEAAGTSKSARNSETRKIKCGSLDLRFAGDAARA
jgi:hypothetical protein